MPDVRKIVSDPQFYGFSPEDRREIMLRVDPDFGRLSGEDQNKALGALESRFRVVGAEQTGLPGAPRFTGAQPKPKTPGVDLSEGVAPVFRTKQQRERGERGLLDPAADSKVPQPAPNPVEHLAGSFSRAVFGLVTGVGNAATAMGLENIGEGIATAGKTGEGLMFRPDPSDGKDFIDDPAKLTDPYYLSNIFGSAAGSMVGFAGAGAGAARGGARVAQALALSEKGRRIAATIGGTTAASLFETMVQAGQSYGEALEMGASPETASDVAAKVARNTLGPTLAFNAAGLYNETVKSGVRRAFASVAGEIAQESSQQVGTNLAFSGTGVDPNRGAFEGVPESALGALAGAGTGSAIVGGGAVQDQQQESAPVAATAGADAGVSAEVTPADVATPEASASGTPAPELKHGIDAALFDETKDFIESKEKISKKEIRERFGLTRDEGETLVNAMVDGGVLSRDEGGRIGRPSVDSAGPAEIQAGEVARGNGEPDSASPPPEPKESVAPNQPAAFSSKPTEADVTPQKQGSSASELSEAQEAAPVDKTKQATEKTTGDREKPSTPTRAEIREADMQAAEDAALRAEADAAHAAAETTPEAEEKAATDKKAAIKARPALTRADNTLKLFNKQRSKAEAAFARVEELRDKLKADPSSADPRELADMATVATFQAAGKKITAEMVDSPGAKEFLRGAESKPKVDNALPVFTGPNKHSNLKRRNDWLENNVANKEHLRAGDGIGTVRGQVVFPLKDGRNVIVENEFDKAGDLRTTRIVEVDESEIKGYPRPTSPGEQIAKQDVFKAPTTAKVDTTARVKPTELPPRERIKQLKNAIAEGEQRLRTKKDSLGKTLSFNAEAAVKKSVENSKVQLANAEGELERAQRPAEPKPEPAPITQPKTAIPSGNYWLEKAEAIADEIESRRNAAKQSAEAPPPPEKAPFKPTVVPPAPDLGGKKLPASVAAQILEAVRPTQESYVDLKEGRKTYTRSPLDDFGKDVSEEGEPFILAGRTEAARKKLVELGLADDSGALTPKGRDVARHLLAQEQRLREGVPIAERPKRRGVPNPFKDSNRNIEVKFEGRTFHSQGNLAVEGVSPVENAVKLDDARIFNIRGPEQEVRPVAYSLGPEGNTTKEIVHFDREGLAVNADFYDYITSKVGSDLEWRQGKDVEGSIHAFKNGKQVALLAPVRLVEPGGGVVRARAEAQGWRFDSDGNPVRDKHNSNGSGRGFLDPSLTFPCQ